MVKFLTTTSISAELEALINSAREEITLISPYLKVNQRLQGFIKDASFRRVRLTVMYGKRDIQEAEWKWMRELTPQPETWYVHNLHAKCYLSESQAIITSMNLYEFSQQNNEEMGIHATAEADQELYLKINEEVKRLRRIAERGQDTPTPTETSRSSTPPRQSAAKPQQPVSSVGYCIRCHTSIGLDPEKPYCEQHYRVWARYGDETYEEKFCHKCGKEHTTSKAKPLCLPCFRRG